MIARASEIAAFSEAVVAAGSIRMESNALWLLWTAAAPRLVGHPSQASVLDDVLRRLNEDGTIELPIRAWDRSTVPPLPRFVIVPSARRAHRTREWESFPWRAELGWVASFRYLSAAGFADLVAVNDWLSRTETTETPIVPVRYRSADIFTKEKRLDDLSRSAFFGPDRLTLEMLACTRMAPPLAAAVVGAGSDILVVENSDTYWVAVDALRNSPGHAIGLVAWGSGKSFPAQVTSLGVDVAGRGPVTGTVWYWGDFDPAGTEIAVVAARLSERIVVRPAVGLWAAMAAVPVQDAGDIDWTGAHGRDWLGPELWAQLTHVRSARGRIAQELVAVETVTAWAGNPTQ